MVSLVNKKIHLLNVCIFGYTLFDRIYRRVTQACYKHVMTHTLNIHDSLFMFMTVVLVIFLGCRHCKNQVTLNDNSLKNNCRL